MIVDRKHLERLRHRHSALLGDRKYWEPAWRDISRLTAPDRARFLVDDANKGGADWAAILNNTGCWARRVFAAGLMSAMCNPSQVWFRLTTHDPDLAERPDVKEFLAAWERIGREFWAKSNAYNAMATLFGDQGFGVHASIWDDDYRTGFRAHCLPIGSFCLAVDDRGEVDTLTREISMTIAQVVGKFGEEHVSQGIRHAYDRGNYHDRRKVLHFVEPNPHADPRRADAQSMPWLSTYIEADGADDSVLRESGYREFPVVAPRWTVASTSDAYGYGPGHIAIGDTIALQELERTKAYGIAMAADPPLIVPGSLRDSLERFPGGITFGDVGDRDVARPLVQAQLDIKGAVFSIQEHEARIKSAFYTDLFLSMQALEEAGSGRMTAREVAERHQEKLLQLADGTNRMQDEALRPAIERSYAILARAGVLPPPPTEIEGQEIKIEYLNVFTAAQQAAGINDAMATWQDAASIAAATGDVSALDGLDPDETIEEIARLRNVSPRIVRSAEARAEIRKQRQQQIAAQQALLQAQAGAQTAQTLSQTDTEGDNALTRMLGRRQ